MPSPVIYTHRDRGVFWGRGFCVPDGELCEPAGGPRTPPVPVCCPVSMAAVYQLKIKYDLDKSEWFFLDAFDMISFPFVHKHVVNEHHIIQKSHDAIQEKYRNV